MQKIKQFVVVIAVFIVSSQILYAAEPKSQKGSLLFDGEKKTFVVNGYSTSFHWPALLQRKLDKYFDGQRIIEVKSATHGGTPIAKWMDLETGKPLPVWTEKLHPLLKNKKQPTFVLAQQSLQWVLGSRSAGIRNATDTQSIDAGVEAIRKYKNLLLSEGADGVILAMHIYKNGMEPQIGNERLALAKLMKTTPKNVFAGPDVWEPTSKVWPQAFQADKIHPNEMGAEIMAHYWFATLLEIDGKEVPAWSEQEMKTAIANPPAQKTGNSPRRDRGKLPPFVLKKFDKDGDGKLSPTEQKTFDEERARRRKNRQ